MIIQINPSSPDLLVCPVPTIAAMSGHATAGGAMLALACDYRIASDNILFFIPAVELGLSYSAGLTALMRAKLTPKLQRDVVLYGKRYRGKELGTAEAGFLGETVDVQSSSSSPASSSSSPSSSDPVQTALQQQLLSDPTLLKAFTFLEESLNIEEKNWWDHMATAHITKSTNTSSGDAAKSSTSTTSGNNTITVPLPTTTLGKVKHDLYTEAYARLHGLSGFESMGFAMRKDGAHTAGDGRTSAGYGGKDGKGRAKM
jgi:enoyl-CoA hydratase/carnithine racemase